MHELALADSLLQQVLRLAAEQGAARIVAIEVRCGVLQQVLPEALRLGFTALSADTAAAGAELTIAEEPLRIRCRPCRTEHAARVEDFRCPACGAANGEIMAGRDVILQSVTCERA
jgi:hydrogenase nickel incorporation protein HypA/HybF